MKNLPLLIVLILLLVGFTVVRRNRQRAAGGRIAAAENLTAGAEVMTTSGLYGTVVAVDHEAGTALLSISPGVEVRWAVAALRVVDELPDRYRRGASQANDDPENGPSLGGSGPQSDDDPTDAK